MQRFHVAEPWWKLIAVGEKTIEGRRLDSPLVKVSAGSTVTLYTDSGEEIIVKILAFHNFSSFREMYMHFKEQLLPDSGVPLKLKKEPWMVYAQWSDVTKPAVGVELKVMSGRPATQFHPAKRIAAFAEPTVWHTFTPLAAEARAVNLGQGFPGWSPPHFVRQHLADATLEKKTPNGGGTFLDNQYARSAGDLSLVKVLGRIYGQRLKREVNPLDEILITNGCTEAFCCTTLSLLNPGDEVVMFEPAFDIYMATVEMAGGISRTVPLFPTDPDPKTGARSWTYDKEALKRSFTSKTRLLILNTPHNPTGKVFTLQELKEIAAIVKQHPNCICISDEVYEHITYDDNVHISIASLPGMYERTVTLSSAGKCFSMTGWKIGWAVGPPHLVRPLAIAHQWICFSVNTPSQIAIARSLEDAEKPYMGYRTYYEWLRHEYTVKRDVLAKGLTNAGIPPIMPQGSFFIMADTSSLRPPNDSNTKNEPHDWAVCRMLTTKYGVACIPPSSFYGNENKDMARDLARFAFCKPEEVLKEAGVRLAKIKGSDNFAPKAKL